MPQTGGNVHSAVCITCTESSKTEDRYELTKGENNIYKVGAKDDWTDKSDWTDQKDTDYKKGQSKLDEQSLNMKYLYKYRSELSRYLLFEETFNVYFGF